MAAGSSVTSCRNKRPAACGGELAVGPVTVTRSGRIGWSGRAKERAIESGRLGRTLDGDPASRRGATPLMQLSGNRRDVGAALADEQHAGVEGCGAVQKRLGETDRRRAPCKLD